jgi:uncharacterized membrane protein
MAGEGAPEVGSVECIVVDFPGSKFKGEIAPALKEIVDAGIVRILDLVFIQKSEDGAVDVLELSQLPDDELSAFDVVDGEVDELLTEEDVAELAELVPAGDSALMVVWENTWAAKVVAAVQRADGRVVFHDRIPAEQVQAAMAALPS